jgi:hypothetical protein
VARKLLPILSLLLLTGAALGQAASSRKQADTTHPLMVFLAWGDGNNAPGLNLPYVTISKNGGAFGAVTGTVGNVGNGWYSVSGAGLATDLDTLGPLTIEANFLGVVAGKSTYTVVAMDPFVNYDPNFKNLADRLTTVESRLMTTESNVVIPLVARLVGLEPNVVIPLVARIAAAESNIVIPMVSRFSGLEPNIVNPLVSRAAGLEANAAAMLVAIRSAFTTSDANAYSYALMVYTKVAAQDANHAGEAVGINWLRTLLGLGGVADANQIKTAANAAAAGADANTTAGHTDDYLTAQHGAGSWQQGVSSGAGAFTYRVMVIESNGTRIQNATVRMTEGVNAYTAVSDSNGMTAFALDAATYGLAITKVGYAFTPTSQIVAGSGGVAKTMTAQVISPATAPDTTNAYCYTYDGHGTLEANVVLTFVLLKSLLAGDYSSASFTATSDSNGLLQVTLLQSSTYSVQRGTGLVRKITIGTAATTKLPDSPGP